MNNFHKLQSPMLRVLTLQHVVTYICGDVCCAYDFWVLDPFARSARRLMLNLFRQRSPTFIYDTTLSSSSVERIRQSSFFHLFLFSDVTRVIFVYKMLSNLCAENIRLSCSSSLVSSAEDRGSFFLISWKISDPVHENDKTNRVDQPNVFFLSPVV